MAHVKRLPDGRYLVQGSYGTGKGRVRVTELWTPPTRRAAEKQAAKRGLELDLDAKAEWQRRQAAAEAGILVRDYLTAWLAEVKRLRAPATWTQYRQVVQATLPALGDLPLAHVTPAHLRTLEQTWRTQGRRRKDPRSGDGPGLTEARVVFRRRILHTAFREAVTRDLLTSNPTERLGRAILPPPLLPRRALTLEEARAVLAALDAPEWQEWHVLWRTALMTGLRIGELRGLRRQDVDLTAQGGWLHVRQQLTRVEGKDVARPPKNKKPRDAAVPPPLVPVLQQHLASHPHALVFADAGGQPLSYDRCRRALHRFMASLGADLTPHEFRHSYATIALAGGVPLSYVSLALGHSNTAVTGRVYDHPFASAQRAAAAQFAAYLTEGERDAK